MDDKKVKTTNKGTKTVKKTAAKPKLENETKKVQPKKSTTKTVAKKVVAKSSVENEVKKTATKVSKTTGTKKTSINKTVPKKTEVKQKTETKKTVAKKPTVKKTVTPKKEVAPVIELEKILVPEEVIAEVDSEIVSEKKIEEPKKVSAKNYIVAGIVVLVILVLSYVGYLVYQRVQEKLYDEGYFYHEKTDIKEIFYDDLSNEISKMTNPAFILVNGIGEKENYDLEKELDKIVNDYHLKSNFYYINFSKQNREKSAIASELNQMFETTKIKTVPTIIYLKDGKVLDIVNRDDNQVLEAADFVKLLDIYEIKK